MNLQLDMRILIVEDLEEWQSLIMRCDLLRHLQQRDPQAIVTAKNYDDAREQLESSRFDLAITDVHLQEPRRPDAFDWRSLADLAERKRVPIVVVSAFLELDLMTDMVNVYNVRGIFDKHNLDPRRFQACLEKVLAAQGKQPPQPPEFTIGDKSAILSWLHFSDLHFSSSDEFDRSIVNETLWQDLKRWGDQGLQPNFIFVTGDIAHSGKPEEYKLAGEFFDQLLDKTAVKEKEKLFFVPGNHDVDLSKISNLARKQVLDDRDSVREILGTHTGRSLFMGRFAGYASFIKAYFSDVKDPLLFDDERYFFCRNLNINNQPIAILGINSAWTSGNIIVNDKISDQGNLVVGEKQVIDALRAAKDAQIRIALMHHPLSYLREFDRKGVETALTTTGCEFLLRGHLHEADVERKTSTKGNLLTIPAGAIFQGRDLINSYNFVTLDVERREARIIFRRYSELQRAWLKDLDATGEDKDGEMQISF